MATKSDSPAAPVGEGGVQVARKVGNYELLRELGRGGMASVYLARRQGPGGFLKWVAIKTIHPHLVEDERFTSMFLDEARIAASIEHPNVVQILDLGQVAGDYFIVMEYLHGEHLRAVAQAANKAGGLPPELAAAIILRTARGLHHAHESKDPTGAPLHLIHRDVSPHNIIVTYDGAVKLADFGVAKAANRITSTADGRVKGKWAYMAPEQVLSEPIDRRADIFALGIVLWEVTTGCRLFQADSDVRTVMRITSGKVPKPSSVVPDYPEKLERIVMRALARRPDDRFGTAAEMADELEDFVALAGRPPRSAELAAFMAHLFPEEKQKKEDLLHHEASRIIDDEPKPTVSERPLPALVNDDAGTSGQSRALSVEVQRPRSSLVLALAIVALLGLGLGGVGLFMLRGRDAVLHLVTEPEGARVTLDGVPQAARTPSEIQDVEWGEHRVTLEREGYEPREETIEVSSARVALRYELRPQSSDGLDAGVAGDTSADVRTTPESISSDAAPESEDSEDQGQPPAEPIRRPRERASTGDERPSRGAYSQPAYLNLLSTPWARVWINGRSAGSTPLVRHEVPSGNLVIRVQAEGTGSTRTLRLRAEPGATISRRVLFDE